MRNLFECRVARYPSSSDVCILWRKIKRSEGGSPMNFSTCLNQKSPARRVGRDVVLASMRSGVSIKSVDTDGIVNTIREPKILTTARTTNADKGLQKAPRVPPTLSPAFLSDFACRKALTHVYAYMNINVSADRETPRRCYVLASVVFLLTTESVFADEATVKFNDVNSGPAGICTVAKHPREKSNLLIRRWN